MKNTYEVKYEEMFLVDDEECASPVISHNPFWYWAEASSRKTLTDSLENARKLAEEYLK